MEFNTDTLSPTYRLLVGIPGESNALTIAQRMGLPESIISKAKAYISEDNKKVEKMIENIKTKSQELDEMRERFARLQEEARLDRERAKQETLIIEKQKMKLLNLPMKKQKK